MSTHSIDYLRYSVPWYGRYMPEALNAVPAHPALALSAKPARPSRGYDAVMALNHCRIEWHSKRPEQKIGVTFSGDGLAACEAAGLAAFELLAFGYLTEGGRVSRLDFAVDSYDESASVGDFWREYQAGRVVTSARSARVLQEHNEEFNPGGVRQTVYVGARSSEKMLRVYNKSAEQETPGTWVRIELECKGDAANCLAQSILEDGLGAAGKQAIRDFCQCDLDWYRRAVTGPSVKIDAVGRKQTDTRRWLIEDVLPVLSRELLSSKMEQDGELYHAFAAALSVWACDFARLATRHDKEAARLAQIDLLRELERRAAAARKPKLRYEQWRITEDWTLEKIGESEERKYYD